MSDAAPRREWRWLIHGYRGIDDDTAWSIVRDDLVPLWAALIAQLATRP